MTQYTSNPISLTDQIRTACARVTQRARYVHINHDQIEPYARTLPLAQVAEAIPDTQHHFMAAPSETAVFFLVLDCINFGSGYFPFMEKLPNYSGYFTIATHLKSWFETEGIPSSQRLAALSPMDCAAIFHQQASETTIMELMTWFARALNDLGHYVDSQFKGNFLNLIESARGSAEALIHILRQMPLFEDVSGYGDIQVPFYKRAQLTVSDLALALPDTSWGRFNDLDRLTLFADNLVPHVLHLDRVLCYDPQLAMNISAGSRLSAGSDAEIEIRACAVHAVELLKTQLQNQGHQITSRELDYLLWNRGQRKFYKSFSRHRTRSVFY